MKRVYPSGASKSKKKKEKMATEVLNCGRLEQFVVKRPNANDELDEPPIYYFPRKDGRTGPTVYRK
jgi:hypothetical protein